MLHTGRRRSSRVAVFQDFVFNMASIIILGDQITGFIVLLWHVVIWIIIVIPR